MTEETRLVLAVDTTQVGTAGTDLDKMAAAGKRAEMSAEALEKSLGTVNVAAAGVGKSVGAIDAATQGATQAIGKTGQAAAALAGTLGVVDGKIVDTAASIGRVGQATGSASAAMAGLSTSTEMTAAASAKAVTAYKALEDAAVKQLATQAALSKATLAAAAAQDAYTKAAADTTATQAQIAAAAVKNEAAQAALAAATLASSRAQESANKASSTYQAALGKSAAQTKLTAYETQQLGFQLNDLFVQIASGQSPITALVQQGSQLSGTFGGLGGTFRALQTVFTPLRLAIGGGAAALAGLALAYNEGSKEDQEFRRTLILTGNAAGVTAGQLGDLAAAIGRSGAGTTGRAAEVLNQLAATGLVGATNLGKFTQAALELERVGGASADETAKAFVALGKAPFDAAVKLNETTGAFTANVLKQIKALEDQGRTVDAARLAQEAYATAVDQRSPALLANLGSIERAWLAIKSATKSAADGLLELGRTDTLGGQLAALQKQLAVLDESRRVGANAGRRQSTFDAERQALDEQIRLISKRILLQSESAAAEAAVADQSRATTKALELQDKYLTSAQRQKREIAEVEQLLLRNALSRRDAELLIGQIKEKYASKNGNREREAEIDLLNKLVGISSTYNDELAILEGLRKRGLLSQDQFADKLRELIALQPFATKAAREESEEQKRLKKEIDDGTKARNAYLESVLKTVEGAAKETLSLQDQLVQLTLGKEALAERIALRLEDQAAAADSAAIWTAVTEAEASAYRQLAAQLREAAKARRALTAGQLEKDLTDANAKAAADAAKEWQRAADQIESALTDSLLRGFESGKGFADNFAEAVKNLFKTMVLRPVIQGIVQPVIQGIVQPVSGAVLNAVYGSATGLSAGASGGITVLQGASLANTLYGLGNGSGIAGTAAAYASNAAVYSGSAYGTAFGSQQSAMLAAQEAGMVSSAGASGASSSLASYAGYAAIIYALSTAAASDFRKGFNKESAKETGTVFGYASNSAAQLSEALGISAEASSILSGATLVAKLIGYGRPNVEGRNIVGTVDSSGFTGTFDTRSREPGGLFRSDRVTTVSDALSGDIDRAIDESTAKIREQAKKYGAALGLPVEQIDAISRSFNVDVTFATQEEAVKRIQDELANYGTSLLDSFAPALESVKNLGETTAQTIERLADNILGINAVFDQLGLKALESSVNGGKAAQSIADLFGGVQGLTGAASVYYEQFFTEAERSANATRQLTEAFADVGLTIPASRDAYRALVEEIANGAAITTDAGQKQFQALLSLSGAFAELNPLIEDSTQKLADLQKSLAGVIADSLGKFQTPEQRAASTYAATARSLQGVGVNVDAATLQTTGKDAIFSFAEAFIAVASNSDAAKQAVIDAAKALAELKDTAALSEIDLKKAADETARQLAVQLQAAIGETLPKFLNADQIAQNAYGAIASSLNTAGVSVDLSAILGASKADIFSFASAFVGVSTNSDAAKLAVVQAASALADLKDAATAAKDAAEAETKAKVDAITSQRLGLEQRELQLLGNTAELRRRELEALAPANREIQERINALTDEQAAASAATRAQEQLSKAIEQAATSVLAGVTSAYNDLVSVGEGERRRIESEAQASIGTLEQQADAARSAFDDVSRSLGGLVDSLQGTAASILAGLNPTQARASAVATLQTQLAIARAGGPINVDAAQSAASVVGRSDPSTFASAVDFRRDALRNAALVGDLATAAQNQLNSAQARQQAELAKIQEAITEIGRGRDEQFNLLDDQLRTAEQQYRALTGINTSVLTVAGAIAALSQSLLAVNATKGAAGATTNQVLRSGDTDVYRAAGGAFAVGPTGASAADFTIQGLQSSFTGAQAQAFAAENIASGNYLAIYQRAVAEGIDSASLDTLLGLDPGTSLRKALELGLPAFAQGTNYVPSDMVAKVHEGERIIPAADNAALMRIISGQGRDEALAAEIKALRAEVAAANTRAQAAMDAIAINTLKTAKTMDQWNIDGQPEVRT